MSHDERSWIERTFGDSGELTLIGFGLGGLGGLVMLMGLIFDSKEAMGLGVMAMTSAIALLGQRARSQSQHDRDYQRTQAYQVPATTPAQSPGGVDQKREPGKAPSAS